MSPEQAKGLPANTRSDIFSFGVVLYEMLTGRQPFAGETAPEMLASVLVRDADLSALPTNLNSRLLDALKRCLDKNPRKRWQAVGDLRIELESIAKAPTAAADAVDVAVAKQPRWRRVLPIGMTALVTAAMAGAIGWMLWPAQAPVPIVARSVFLLPDGQNFTNVGRQAVAISPDGSRLVYVANTRLYLKSMSELESRPVPGTEVPRGDFVSSPVFSPDGQSIAFWSGPAGGPASPGQLQRIAISGGVPVPISQILTPDGMTWVGDTIIRSTWGRHHARTGKRWQGGAARLS
jgi:serine/threonine-protein kinase